LGTGLSTDIEHYPRTRYFTWRRASTSGNGSSGLSPSARWNRWRSVRPVATVLDSQPCRTLRRGQTGWKVGPAGLPAVQAYYERPSSRRQVRRIPH